MELEWWMYPIIFILGAVAGFINTLAGNGSAITLPVLVFLGLPATVANGTNRVGIILQTIIGYRTFHRKGLVPTKGTSWLIVPTMLGAIIGASIAVELDEEMMNKALGLLMLVLLGIVLLNPKKWIQPQNLDNVDTKSIKNILMFFVIGLHGGFLQAGVGVLLLSALVLGVGYSLNNANGVKLLIVLFFSVPALLLFVYNGQVNWFYGALMAIGQSGGAWIAATFATEYEGATIWIRRLLIVVILVGIVKFWKLYELFVF